MLISRLLYMYIYVYMKERRGERERLHSLPRRCCEPELSILSMYVITQVLFWNCILILNLCVICLFVFVSPRLLPRTRTYPIQFSCHAINLHLRCPSRIYCDMIICLLLTSTFHTNLFILKYIHTYTYINI